MKNYKFLALAAVIGLTAMGSYTLISNAASDYSKYQEALQQAREQTEKDVMEDAIAQYQKALAIHETLDLNLEIGQAYLDHGWSAEAAAWGEDIVEKYGKEPKAYTFLAKCYYETEDYDKCFALRDEAKKKNVLNDEFKELMTGIEYLYTLEFESFDEVSVYGGKFCAVLKDGKWGYVNTKGSRKISYMFAQAFPFNSAGNAAVQSMDGEWYYISDTGNKAIPVQNMTKCLSLGIIIDNVLAACDNGIYAYYDTDFNKLSPSDASWNYATAVNQGVGAVLEKGKWKIVDSTGQPLCSETYEGVVYDEKEIACRNGRLFVKTGDSYKMIDTSGQQIGNDTYNDAKVFLQADSYAAVKSGQKWGFVDKDGSMVIPAQFDDARSFSNGYAAVKMGKQWGYILPDGSWAIPAQFTYVGDFNSKECAFVNIGDEWRYLKLLRSNY